MFLSFLLLFLDLLELGGVVGRDVGLVLVLLLDALEALEGVEVGLEGLQLVQLALDVVGRNVACHLEILIKARIDT